MSIGARQGRRALIISRQVNVWMLVRDLRQALSRTTEAIWIGIGLAVVCSLSVFEVATTWKRGDKKVRDGMR